MVVVTEEFAEKYLDWLIDRVKVDPEITITRNGRPFVVMTACAANKAVPLPREELDPIGLRDRISATEVLDVIQDLLDRYHPWVD